MLYNLAWYANTKYNYNNYGETLDDWRPKYNIIKGLKKYINEINNDQK